MDSEDLVQIEEIFDRVDEEGMVATSVKDGTIFVFTLDMLNRLVADAEDRPEKKVIVFVRRGNVANG